MKIRRLTIRRFRGIRELDWDPDGDFICLVGPGDSTKSTILEAIEIAISPRWNVSIDDSDFHDCVTAQPIEITATIGELPEELRRDSRFGLEKGSGATGSAWSEHVPTPDSVVARVRQPPSFCGDRNAYELGRPTGRYDHTHGSGLRG
jgi:energy-coupling factor transporter ATP-binding protein EcfA2